MSWKQYHISLSSILNERILFPVAVPWEQNPIVKNGGKENFILLKGVPMQEYIQGALLYYKFFPHTGIDDVDRALEVFEQTNGEN